MELLFIAAIGYGVYWLFRQNTKSGEETVRAYIYLGLLGTGRTEHQANQLVEDISSVSVETIQRATIVVQALYGGKQLALIADAYRNGMIPRSSWAKRRVISRGYDLRTRDDDTSSKPANSPSVPPTPEPATSNGPVTEGPYGSASPQTPQDHGFDEYYAAYVSKLKVLAGIAPTDLHMVELMDDEPLRQAFRDGVPVNRLVEMHAEHWAQMQPRR